MTQAGGPRCWHLAIDDVPVSGNHQYRYGEEWGSKRRFLTAAAKRVRADFETAALHAGFSAELGRHYQVRIVFTVKSADSDIDNYLKGAIDAIFGPNRDHLIYLIQAEKRVVPGKARTEVWITELP